MGKDARDEKGGKKERTELPESSEVSRINLKILRNSDAIYFLFPVPYRYFLKREKRNFRYFAVGI
ncbi:hypothetical protein DFP94_10674 [Fontibacillus phaseoli]|uniref:Uncharacterized protein n=1 Tax=Fontibacillus phaseoli TaxID=1416533 RepID=A0A369BAV5_9BACL|nr:hypothetical protein DFP94_10674 [Fontibacillus phaseoli]